MLVFLVELIEAEEHVGHPVHAGRDGQGVAVLLRVYAGCIDGHGTLWNHRIDEALREHPKG